jgi:cytoskeletal protein CcmA (bactofilin family)
MNIIIRITTIALAAGILFAAGCGGGGSDGGGANPPPPPPPTGGITRTGVGFAVGPITGFGSVIVNGVTYETSGNTSFTKDGQPATQDDFSVGEHVVVTGSIDDNNSNAAAASVESNDIVEGPASSHNTTTNQLVVLGQTVQISATTSVDDSCPADLTAAPAVEVYGTVDLNGVIDATRVECRDATWDGVMEINGSATNVTATTFEINGFVVDYSAAAVDDFPTAGVINEDDPVEAKGDTLNGGALEADRVEYKGNRFDINEGDHIEIEGFITRFASATDFDVSGIPVTTLANTTYEGGTAADLGQNLKVEVEGEFDGNDVLNATKIEIKTSTAIRVTGTLDSAAGDTLTILGITVNTSATKTRFEDKSDADVDPMSAGDLNGMDYVEIRGQELPPGQITAMIVERDDADTRTELRGFVEVGGKAEPNLTVLGVTVVTNGATQYRDSRGESETVMQPADFWAAVQEGSLVDARGTETGVTMLTATELELEGD